MKCNALFPEVCGCEVCTAVFSEHIVAVCQALVAQFERDDLALEECGGFYFEGEMES
jgi:hypothetical protein